MNRNNFLVFFEVIFQKKSRDMHIYFKLPIKIINVNCYIILENNLILKIYPTI